MTGANSGVGYEITKFLALHGARVHMVCRNKTKAEKARSKIFGECEKAIADAEKKTSEKPDIRLLIADVSLESDVRRVWKDFLKDSSSSSVFSSEAKEDEKEEKTSSPQPRLDGLVCNAGALLNNLTVTKEGVEVTFAAHLLYVILTYSQDSIDRISDHLECNNSRSNTGTGRIFSDLSRRMH